MKLRFVIRLLVLAALGALCLATAAGAADKPPKAAKAQPAPAAQEWEVVVPMGVVAKANLKPAPRLSSLDGKTIVLRWNGKHNGDVFLTRVSELLAERVPTAKVVKAWEQDTSMNKISGSASESKRIAGSLKAMGADIVIASQCD
jgi:predicted dinucleotide-binding enzyme